MNGVRPANGLCAGFGQTEKAHFAFAYQVRHRANCFFDRCIWINSMLIVKIDYIHTEPAQTSFACLTDVIRFAADPAKFQCGRVPENSKLCRNNDLFMAPSKGAPKQLLVRMRAVHIGGVEECDSELQGAINCSQRFLFVSSAVKIRHSHATETDCRDNRSTASKFSLFHTFCDSIVSL